MSMPPSGLCILALVVATALASRPELDEIHIATSGHFVQNSGPGSHHHHRARHHASTHNERSVSERKTARHRAQSDMHGNLASGNRNVHHHKHIPSHHNHQDQEQDSQQQQHALREQHRMRVEKAKHDFYIDAAANYAEDVEYIWSESIPYWMCRMALAAALIYSLINSLKKQKQDLSFKMMKEPVYGPAADSPEEAASHHDDKMCTQTDSCKEETQTTSDNHQDAAGESTLAPRLSETQTETDAQDLPTFDQTDAASVQNTAMLEEPSALADDADANVNI